MENLRAFHVIYKGPTNSRGSRVIIKDLRFNKKIIIAYNYEFNDVGEIAENYLKKINIKIDFCAEAEKGYILLTRNFITQLKD